MSIYDKGMSFDFYSIYEKAKYPVIILGAIIAVFVIYLVVSSLATVVQPKMLEAQLRPNSISVDAANTTLYVKVNNVAEYDIYDLRIKIDSADPRNIFIYPRSRTIPTLGTKESRELTFTVDPLGDIPPGKYRIDIRATSAETDEKIDVILELKS